MIAAGRGSACSFVVARNACLRICVEHDKQGHGSPISPQLQLVINILVTQAMCTRDCFHNVQIDCLYMLALDSTGSRVGRDVETFAHLLMHAPPWHGGETDGLHH